MLSHPLSSRRRATRRRAAVGAIIAAAATAAAVLPPAASAGEYTAYSCRGPGLLKASTAGWSVWHNKVHNLDIADNCASGAATGDFGIQGNVPGLPDYDCCTSSSMGIALTLPEGLRLKVALLNRMYRRDEMVTMDWRGVGSSPPTGMTWNLWETRVGGSTFSHESGRLGRPPDGPFELYMKGDVKGLAFQQACFHHTEAEEYCHRAGYGLALRKAELRIDDIVPPKLAGKPTGSLVETQGALSGPATVTFGGTDVGGGVAKAALEVDGKIVAEAAIGGATCKEPYLAIQPCAVEDGKTLELDTKSLADGEHFARVIIRDVGGNEVASEPYPFTTSNIAPPAPAPEPSPTATPDPGVAPAAPAAAAGVPNGVNAGCPATLTASFSPKRSRARMTVAFSKRAVVSGKLTGPAGPIVNAEIVVLSRIMTAGAQPQILSLVRTGKDGGYSYKTTSVSQQIVLAYRLLSTDPGYCATASVTLIRRAGVTLKAPRRAFNKQCVNFRGLVRAVGVKRAGRIGLFQVEDFRAWNTFDDAKTNKMGEVLVRYCFTRTFRPICYRFRLVVKATRDSPYATGRSRAQKMCVRPR